MLTNIPDTDGTKDVIMNGGDTLGSNIVYTTEEKELEQNNGNKKYKMIQKNGK